MRKPKVGDTLFVVTGQPYGRRKKETGLREVTKVGSKYFYLDDVQFHIDTWSEKTEYSSYYSVYGNEQEYLDIQELKTRKDIIRKAFDLFERNKHTLEQLRSVCDVLGLELPKDNDK